MSPSHSVSASASVCDQTRPLGNARTKPNCTRPKVTPMPTPLPRLAGEVSPRVRTANTPRIDATKPVNSGFASSESVRVLTR